MLSEHVGVLVVFVCRGFFWRTSTHVKPEWQEYRYRRTLIVFPSRLTEQGRRARRWSLRFILGFIISPESPYSRANLKEDLLYQWPSE